MRCRRDNSEGEELHFTEAWNTRSSERTPSEAGLQMFGAIADLKARGNVALKAGAQGCIVLPTDANSPPP